MKGGIQKVFSKIMAAVMILSLCLSCGTISGASADSVTTAAIEAICREYGFKSGAYWTYDYTNVAKDQKSLDAAATRNYKASTKPYGTQKYRSQYYSGSDTYYGEYIFYGGRQCFAFANYIGYLLTGTVPTASWGKYSSVAQVEKAGGLKPGDVIRAGGHSAMVLRTSGSTVYTVECWGSTRSKNKISVGGFFNGDAGTLAEINRKYKLSYVLRFTGSISSTADTSAPVISASGETYPAEGSNLKQGGSFGLRGVYTTSSGTITSVTATLKDRNGATWFTYTANPKTQKYDVNGTKGSNGKTLNDTMAFNKLSNGSYTLSVTIQAENAGKTDTKNVIRNLTVGTQSSPVSNIEIKILKAFNGPDSISKGRGFGLRGIASASRGKITKVTASVKRSNGTTALSYSATPGSTSFDVTKTKGTNGKSLNDTMVFNYLDRGTYTYTVELTAEENGVTKTYRYTKQFRIV